MVIAMDVSDLLTPRIAREGSQYESLAGKQVDIDSLTKVFTSIKGVTLTVEATERLNGKVRVDLGESATPVKGVARVLILEGRREERMLPSGMKDWRFLSEAKAVTLEGRMAPEELRTLTELIPFPVATVDLKGGSIQ